MQVKEPLLVKDVLYACQGVNGKYTAYQVMRVHEWHQRVGKYTLCINQTREGFDTIGDMP